MFCSFDRSLGKLKENAWESSKGLFFHMQDSQRFKELAMNLQDMWTCGRPYRSKVGVLLVPLYMHGCGEAQGGGAFRLSGAQINSPASGFVPDKGIILL